MESRDKHLLSFKYNCKTMLLSLSCPGLITTQSIQVNVSLCNQQRNIVTTLQGLFCTMYAPSKHVTLRLSLKANDMQLSTSYCIIIGASLASTNYYYSGSPLNRHPSTADTHNITDTCDCPDHISIDFNTLKTPEQQTTCYSIKRTPFSVQTRLCS